MNLITQLVKARLIELDEKFDQQINEQEATVVQFNPESLKVSFSNQLDTPATPGDPNGTSKRLFVGSGTTKLSLQLWFDATAPVPEGALPDNPSIVEDVRVLTRRVTYFITPKPNPADKSKQLPPAVRFLWGSFKFDGIMDSLEENLEFFSNEGVPLRASMTLNLSQQRIVNYPPEKSGSGLALPGTVPFVQAPAGASLQGLAANAGKGANWQAIAQANGIENPRLLAPGQLVNLNVKGPRS